jgi:hypothetical protein
MAIGGSFLMAEGKANHPPPSTVEIKKTHSYISSVCLHGMKGDKLTFNFILTGQAMYV